MLTPLVRSRKQLSRVKLATLYLSLSALCQKEPQRGGRDISHDRLSQRLEHIKPCFAMYNAHPCLCAH